MENFINLQLALKDFKYTDDLKCLRVYLEILFNANDQKRFYKGHEIKVGELVVTLSYLKDKFKKTRPQITEKMIRNILVKLEKDNLITRRVIKSNKKDLFTVISVKNFIELRSTQHLISFKNLENKMGTQEGKQKNAQSVDIISEPGVKENKRASKWATNKESTFATEKSFANKNEQMPLFGNGNKKSTIPYTNSQLYNKKNEMNDEYFLFNSSDQIKNKEKYSCKARTHAEIVREKDGSTVVHSPQARGNTKNRTNDLPDMAYNVAEININYVNALSPKERERYKANNSISKFCSVALYQKILSISKLVVPYFNKFSPKFSYGIRSNKPLWAILECYVLKGITDVKDYLDIIDYASTLIITKFNPHKVDTQDRPLSSYFTLQTVLVNKGIEYLSLSREVSNKTNSTLKMDFYKSEEQVLDEAIEKSRLKQEKQRHQENLEKKLDEELKKIQIKKYYDNLKR